MAKGHRSQIKRERNAVKDTRPSAKLSYARVSVQKACFVLDAIRGKSLEEALGIVTATQRRRSGKHEISHPSRPFFGSQSPQDGTASRRPHPGVSFPS